MAKPGRLPNFRKMYPEASEEVIEVLKETERKMQYQEYDLKAEQTIIDQEAQGLRMIPSREDSYERLLDMSVQFEGETPSTEEQVLKRIESEQLHRTLSFLSDEEQYLIQQIYFNERTERDLAEELRCSQNAVNKRKQRILDKLRRFLENF